MRLSRVYHLAWRGWGAAEGRSGEEEHQGARVADHGHESWEQQQEESTPVLRQGEPPPGGDPTSDAAATAAKQRLMRAERRQKARAAEHSESELVTAY